jgi:uncharacterized peroxidase-related enzyme
MTAIALVDPEATTGKLRAMLAGIAARRGGRVPPMIRALANSPAALGAFLRFGAELANGTLTPALRERIALAVAAANDCAPCLATHTMLGAEAGLSPEELAAARAGRSADPTAQAVLSFALAALRGTGHVAPEALAALRAAGFGDDAAMEILATVNINVFTNAVNHLAGTTPADGAPAPA